MIHISCASASRTKYEQDFKLSNEQITKTVNNYYVCMTVTRDTPIIIMTSITTHTSH